jgi:GMP synthase (glutamine-hydrolysing)
MLKPILILKTGSTLPTLAARKGDFEDWILAGLGTGKQEALIVDVTRGERLPDPGRLAGVVVTGSHAMVTERLPWSERAAEWLAGAVDHGLPSLGICYGHQLLAHALGGEVLDNPHGREYGTAEICLTPEGLADPLFCGLPPTLQAQVSHVQSVVRLPHGARRLACSAGDGCQAFAVGQAAWGVQFHPEFDAEIARAYLQHSRAALAAQGQDPDRLLAGIVETPTSAGILKRFFVIVLERHS